MCYQTNDELCALYCDESYQSGYMIRVLAWAMEKDLAIGTRRDSDQTWEKLGTKYENVLSCTGSCSCESVSPANLLSTLLAHDYD